MAKTYLFWDPVEDNIVRECDEAGAITAEYTTEPDQYGNVISQRRQGEYCQFHYDAQGSTLAATDANQNVSDTFSYTAFGEVSERAGSTLLSFLYFGRKGYYLDSLTGQHIVRRRVYSPITIRWQSSDPIGSQISHPNIYSYAHNSPLALFDPSGLQGTVIFVFEQLPPGYYSTVTRPYPAIARPATLAEPAPAPVPATPWAEIVLRPILMVRPWPKPKPKPKPKSSDTEIRVRVRDCKTLHPKWPICPLHWAPAPDSTASDYLRRVCSNNRDIWIKECFVIPELFTECGPGGGRQMHCTMEYASYPRGLAAGPTIRPVDTRYRVSVRCCNCCSRAKNSIEEQECGENAGGHVSNAHFSEGERPPECHL